MQTSLANSSETHLSDNQLKVGFNGDQAEFTSNIDYFPTIDNQNRTGCRWGLRAPPNAALNLASFIATES